jgi:hypothetical protein
MIGQHWHEDVLREFRRLKRGAEKALAQVSDEEFFRALDPESNSLAVIVKHMAGNLRSRWMDFLTSDGEKPDRRRDSEFMLEPGDTRAALMERWERGWKYLFDALEPLGEGDLMRTLTIRDEPHTVVQAVNRQLTHYGAHVGQIIFLAKHLVSSRSPRAEAPSEGGSQAATTPGASVLGWQTLSVPRGQSEQFNQKMKERAASRPATRPSEVAGTLLSHRGTEK